MNQSRDCGNGSAVPFFLPRRGTFSLRDFANGCAVPDVRVLHNGNGIRVPIVGGHDEGNGLGVPSTPPCHEGHATTVPFPGSCGPVVSPPKLFIRDVIGPMLNEPCPISCRADKLSSFTGRLTSIDTSILRLRTMAWPRNRPLSTRNCTRRSRRRIESPTILPPAANRQSQARTWRKSRCENTRGNWRASFAPNR